MIFVLQYLLLKFVSRYYENWVVKSWGYSQIERLLLLHWAVLGDNKGWKKNKSFAKARRNIRNRNMVQGRQPPPETWPDTALVVLFSPCYTAFLYNPPRSYCTTNNRSPMLISRWNPSSLSLSLSLVIEDRTHVRREFRDSGQKETLMNRKLGHLFPVYLSKSLKKHIFPI